MEKNYKIMHNTKIDIQKDAREQIVEILNARLADSIDLHSQAKQAHWNVKGMSFIALHELFDQAATEVDGYVDMIAERVTILGGTAEGTVRVSASKSTLPQYPLEIAEGRDHVEALSTAFATFGKNVRQNIDDISEIGDADTEDLFTEVSRGIDKMLWFIEAHIQS